MDSRVYDRYRKLKQRLGKSFLYPPILIEVVVTNIEAKNQFRRVYRDEEMKILEETNRVFEIERFLERNPDVNADDARAADQEVPGMVVAVRRRPPRRQHQARGHRRAEAIHAGRHRRVRTTADVHRHRPARSRVEEARGVHGAFPSDVPTDVIEGGAFPRPACGRCSRGEPDDGGGSDPDRHPAAGSAAQRSVSQDHVRSRDGGLGPIAGTGRSCAGAGELQLEPWEVASYRRLVEGSVRPRHHRSGSWTLFFLRSAALRIKMDDERRRDLDVAPSQSDERVFDLLERCGPEPGARPRGRPSVPVVHRRPPVRRGDREARTALSVEIPVPPQLLRAVARPSGTRRFDTPVGDSWIGNSRVSCAVLPPTGGHLDRHDRLLLPVCDPGIPGCQRGPLVGRSDEPRRGHDSHHRRRLGEPGLGGPRHVDRALVVLLRRRLGPARCDARKVGHGNPGHRPQGPLPDRNHSRGHATLRIRRQFDDPWYRTPARLFPPRPAGSPRHPRRHSGCPRATESTVTIRLTPQLT